MGDSGLSRRRGECSWSVIGRGDREQKWLFLFPVCKFLADQEHLGAYAGAQNGNCRVAGQLMRHPSTGTTQAQAPSNYPQQLSNRQSYDYRKENR